MVPCRQGFCVGGKSSLTVPTEAASSGVLVLPSSVMPALRARATAMPSRSATRSRHLREPYVQGMPRTGWVSFTPSVIPASGPCLATAARSSTWT